jgi:hypothetical protein
VSRVEQVGEQETTCHGPSIPLANHSKAKKQVAFSSEVSVIVTPGLDYETSEDDPTETGARDEG